MRLAILTLAAMVGVASAPDTASSAVVLSFVEDGAGVVGTLSGSLNLEGAISAGTVFAGAAILWPSVGVVQIGPGLGLYDAYQLSPVAGWGSGDATLAHFSSGSQFGLRTNFSGAVVTVAQGYLSGSPLSGSITFLGRTFSALGVTPGTYVYNLPNDTITVSFSAIPLPATLPLLAAGLGLLSLPIVRRRRRPDGSI